MTFILHEIISFGRSVPWPNKIPTPQEQWECTKLVLLSYLSMELPMVNLGFLSITEWVGMQTYHVPFPSIKTTPPQIAAFFVFKDTFHYFAHQVLHYGPLYTHHKYSAPFELAAE
ncbi:hypothetical protein B0H16DRAFT_1665987 [Mycena metata]|uniref:Uncharacterized protein n=1 Tax=Mycena metata TaxID=1033252 RepID=A0AAD7HPW0_9AGAR|nr:hypothetical protein B0H16DRAFT_1665987 [Mycena metata]